MGLFWLKGGLPHSLGSVVEMSAKAYVPPLAASGANDDYLCRGRSEVPESLLEAKNKYEYEYKREYEFKHARVDVYEFRCIYVYDACSIACENVYIDTYIHACMHTYIHACVHTQI